MAEDVTVSEAIRMLRAEIDKARKEGDGEQLRFRIPSVEVELTIALKSEVGGKAGVKAWFVELSGNAKRADEMTHKVKLTLQPIGTDGGLVVASSAEREEDQPPPAGKRPKHNVQQARSAAR